MRKSIAGGMLPAIAALLLVTGNPGSASAQSIEYADSYAQDRAEIEDLMARYLFAMDYNDFEAYGATFTVDGELEFASGATRGRENIKATAREFKERIGEFYRTADGSPATLRHVLAHSAIRVEGDRAWGRSLWFEMANDGPEGALKMGTFGIYEDELVRLDGRWLFSKRRILNEFIPNRHSGPGNPVADMDALAEAWLGEQGQ